MEVWNIECVLCLRHALACLALAHTIHTRDVCMMWTLKWNRYEYGLYWCIDDDQEQTRSEAKKKKQWQKPRPMQRQMVWVLMNGILSHFYFCHWTAQRNGPFWNVHVYIPIHFLIRSVWHLFWLGCFFHSTLYRESYDMCVERVCMNGWMDGCTVANCDTIRYVSMPIVCTKFITSSTQHFVELRLTDLYLDTLRYYTFPILQFQFSCDCGCGYGSTAQFIPINNYYFSFLAHVIPFVLFSFLLLLLLVAIAWSTILLPIIIMIALMLMLMLMLCYYSYWLSHFLPFSFPIAISIILFISWHCLDYTIHIIYIFFFFSV